MRPIEGGINLDAREVVSVIGQMGQTGFAVSSLRGWIGPSSDSNANSPQGCDISPLDVAGEISVTTAEWQVKGGWILT
jgi:hypothetical protein